MTRFLWLTDLHLNFLPDEQIQAFLQSLVAMQPDGLLFTGDLAESHNVVHYLQQLDDALQRPFYFVLGNHDFYYGSINNVRQRVADLCQSRPNLHYMTQLRSRPPTSTVGVVGHDGWADGRLGDYARSYVMMNDYKLIQELAGYAKLDRWHVLQELGDQAAEHIRNTLPEALERFAHVVLLTHVPPFRAACWHEGQISDDEWAPHFTCKAVGDALMEIIPEYPHRQLTVLCGHTHGAGETRPLPNMLVLTGGAEYGRPSVARVFEF